LFSVGAIEKDPVHGKLKQRFVSGLKQVTNGVKAARARLVLLAIDTEDSEALDGTFLIVELHRYHFPSFIYSFPSALYTHS
jgi:hypothetical protein